jgi:hypothetical protein
MLPVQRLPLEARISEMERIIGKQPVKIAIFKKMGIVRDISLIYIRYDSLGGKMGCKT